MASSLWRTRSAEAASSLATMSGESPAQVRVQASLSLDERTHVLRFLEAAQQRDGARLDDHLASDLTHGPGPGFLAAIATGPVGDIVGYAQSSQANDGVSVGCVAGDDAPLAAALLEHLVAAIPTDRSITWWATDLDHALAARLGLDPDRRLLHMRVPLPVAATTDVDVRPFRPGADDATWLAVNNAAFAWHGEQGGWTLATLQQRQQEPWFDPAGFLIHEREGRMAAFCWTKMHPDAVGEIYVIAVHPDFHGLGLGKALTVAGLHSLHRAGATTAMLFVDADNTAAVGLYHHLGFVVDSAKQAYRRPDSPHPSQGSTP